MNLRTVLGLLAVVAWTGGNAQEAAVSAAPALTVQQAETLERERIRQFRAEEEARFAGEEAQCYQRFAVNDCLLQVRRARRDVLADLRRQEMSINDAQRKRRAAEQLLRSDEKAAR